MCQFSTIFFVEGNPVKYEVWLNGGIYILHPSENPNQFIAPPMLQAQQKNGRWEVSGTADRDLIDQAVEDLESYQNKHRLGIT